MLRRLRHIAPTVIAVLFVVAALFLVFHLGGGWVTFAPIVGVVLGAAAAALPTMLRDHYKRKNEIRVASLMWRDDFHEFQDVLERGLRKRRWEDITAPTLADTDDLGLIAAGLKPWGGWNPIVNARRQMVRVREKKDSGASFHEALPTMEKAWNAINAAKPYLTKLDGGPATPHGQNTNVQRMLIELMAEAKQEAP